MITDRLLIKFPIISDQVDARELRVLLRELEILLKAGKRGNVVEFGCYVGTTSLFIRRLLDAYYFVGEFHVYDSFVGLPPKTDNDISVAGDQFKTGELFAARKTLLENFKRARLAPPIVHKGWFHELQLCDVPRDIMYAFLDGDYYESIKDSLRLVTPNMMTPSAIVIDDYANEALPGAAKAADEWAKAKGKAIRSEASLGLIHL